MKKHFEAGSAAQRRTPDVIVALDMPEAAQALELADSLRGSEQPPWLKVGLELFTVAGPDMVRGLVERECQVFLDLKLHDIPNTVSRAARASARLGAHLITLHISGGEAMIRQAVEALHEGGEGPCRPLALGITLLTSDDGKDLPGGMSPAEFVVSQAMKAKAWGLDGVVCSGHEVAAVKAACGSELLCVTPGIRPVSYLEGVQAVDDQRRIMTPAKAVVAGADFLVIGRPITQAIDPAAALRGVRAEIAEALSQ